MYNIFPNLTVALLILILKINLYRHKQSLNGMRNPIAKKYGL